MDQGKTSLKAAVVGPAVNTVVQQSIEISAHDSDLELNNQIMFKVCKLRGQSTVGCRSFGKIPATKRLQFFKDLVF